MTFKPLTDTLGEELLTSYLADFPVKTLVPQDAGLESPGKNPACGNTWHESLGRYDHSTHTLKTAQCSLFEDSTLSSPTLPRWGSMQSGELFRRQTLVRPTDATESGLWPTPTSTLGTNGGLVTPSKAREGGTLIEALSARTLWPTPTAHNAKEFNSPSEALRNEPTLAARAGGALNPTWVEWLMGWPLGWTDLKPLEMDKYQQWLRQHGVY
jgi:hypothetical protein